MAWSLEYDPGLTGTIYEFAYFNGDMFAFCRTGTGAGVWKRTPPGPPLWTRVHDYSPEGRAAVWDGKIFAAGAQYIYRCEDGVNWTQDFDPGCGGPYSYWSALGGYGSHLYAYMYGMCAVTTSWVRRDTAGNWTQYPPDTGVALGHGDDIIPYGGRVHFSFSTNVRYYDGSWHVDSISGSQCYFITLGSTLYAALQNGNIYYRTDGGWVLDHSLSAAWSISIGGDNTLYTTDGTDVYARESGSWTSKGTPGGTMRAAGADGSGNLFAGTDSCEFYYCPNPDQQVISGNGLPHQALACDGNGDAIYICLYDSSGHPILVKAVLPMHYSHTGNRIFNPGAGDAINVKASEFTGDYIIVSGKFAANNDTCRRSTDGGSTLTDIDGDWGSDRSQPIGLDINDDNHVLLPIDGATDDLMETEDCSSWVALDNALPFDVSALAMHDLDPNELFIGNIAAAASLVKYSPNNASTWSDITGALDITGGIANIEVV